MKPHIQQLFTAVFNNLNMYGTLDHYLNQIENTEDYKFLIFKRGLRLIDTQDDYTILPTTYEVWLDMLDNAIVYIIGNLEVYRERYQIVELLKIFQNESIVSIMEPDPSDIKKYLSAIRLLNPEVSVGKQVKLEQLMDRIKDGEIPVGRYFEKKEEGYDFLEISEENNEAVLKRIFCLSLNHIVYALIAGGDLKIEEKSLNEKIYEAVNYKIQHLSTEFNKEVLMSLIGIEQGIDNYNELLGKVSQL